MYLLEVAMVGYGKNGLMVKAGVVIGTILMGLQVDLQHLLLYHLATGIWMYSRLKMVN